MENIIEIAGYEFIQFPATEEGVPVVSRKALEIMQFGNTNDLRESKVLAWLQEEFLPKIVASIGEENLVSFRTDLTALDGQDDYGTMDSKISLPTLDFYRDNYKIFSEYPAHAQWWLSTPDSCKRSGEKYADSRWLTLSVGAAGTVYNIAAEGRYIGFAVRPMLMLRSSI